MGKRDYKSYNILEEELHERTLSQDTIYTEVQEVDIKMMSENEDNKEDIWHEYNLNENKEIVDMTFSGYKNYYQTKERSMLVKWSIRIVKVILVLMLLPFITIIGGTIALFIGGFIAAIIFPIVLGIIILGAVCFISTQIETSLIALGITVSITAISLGGILLILFCMLIKESTRLLKKYKKPQKEKIKKEDK